MDDNYDVIAITVHHDDFEDAIAGVIDWVILANGVTEVRAAELVKEVDEEFGV